MLVYRAPSVEDEGKDNETSSAGGEGGQQLCGQVREPLSVTVTGFIRYYVVRVLEAKLPDSLL